MFVPKMNSLRNLQKTFQITVTFLIPGKLDCLRDSIATGPNFENETKEQREARIDANWTSDCAFEAVDNNGNASWFEDLYNIFKINTLVNVSGVNMSE